MKVEFSRAFLRDIRKLHASSVHRQLRDVISQLETSADLRQVPNVKKIEGYGNYYRLRIGQYRLGFKLENGGIQIMRFLHRREVYRYFP